jgi:hypothetical protein
MVFFVSHTLQEWWYVHPLSYFLWFMSLNEFQFLYAKSNSWNHALPTLHVFQWLACICFIPCLSSWCLWTNIIRELMLIKVVGVCDMVWWYDLLSKCLSTWEFYLKNWKPFSAKLLFDLSKSYQSHMMSYLENLILIWCLLLHWALSNCCDPCENCFHAFMIKIHVHHHIPLLYFYTGS